MLVHNPSTLNDLNCCFKSQGRGKNGSVERPSIKVKSGQLELVSDLDQDSGCSGFSCLLCGSETPQPCNKLWCNGSSLKGRTLLRGWRCRSALRPTWSLTWTWSTRRRRMERLLRRCRIKTRLVRECMAECLGVYVLIVSIWQAVATSNIKTLPLLLGKAKLVDNSAGLWPDRKQTVGKEGLQQRVGQWFYP